VTPRIRNYIKVVLAAWTVFSASLLFWEFRRHTGEMEFLALSEARASWQRDTLYRAWAASLIGSFVPLTEATPPNPYLADLPNRDVGTTSGTDPTLINPAYMTRKVHGLVRERFGPVSHIASLRPINPANAPDLWERGAFASFEKGETEVSSVEPVNGKPHMRLMRPVVAEPACLTCHDAQGYKAGGVLGGISISIPMEPFLVSWRAARSNDLLAVGLLWLVGSALILGGGLRIERYLDRVSRSEEALRRERNRAQRYLDTVEAIIVALDAEGRITSINRKGCQLLGRSEQDLVGLEWFSHCLPQPEGKEKVFPPFLKLMKGDIESTEYFGNSIVSGTGEIREIAWHNALLRDENGRVTGTLSSGEDITEQRRLQDEVRKKSDFLASILKNSPDAIIGNDSTGNIFLFNEAAEKIYGYTAAEAIGKLRASALYPPGGAREVKEFIYAEGFGGRGRLLDFETKIVTRTGELIPIRLSCELLHEDGREIGTIGFFHDISGRLALQNHLMESESKFRTLFETASDAILSIDEDGLILMANRAAKDVFEYPGNEIVGINVRGLLGSGQEGTWEVLTKFASRSEPGKYVEATAMSRSGKTIPFHVSVSENVSGGRKFYTTIMRDVSQIKAYEEDLQVLANTDSLTRLFNRRQLYPIIQKELDRVARRKVPFSVLLMDIDHFKKFNDTYGHAGGDLLLAGFADKIREAFRQMDSAFRFGGEEFVVLLPETTGQEAMIPAERFRQRIADSPFLMPPDRQPVSVTISVGLAVYRDGDMIDDVIRRADLAMYAAKYGGRNQVVDYDHLTKPKTP
jgi:diguanylate cyclase (GGDEF)-like protein/PAS domain S-box-containing protein